MHSKHLKKVVFVAVLCGTMFQTTSCVSSIGSLVASTLVQALLSAFVSGLTT